MYLIIERTSSVVDFGIIFNVYFTRTFLLNATKEKRLLSRASPICTVQFTALPNMGARQIERHAFSHLFVNKSSWQASNTNTRILFPVSVHVLFNSLCTVNIMSLDTDLILWKLSRLLNDDRKNAVDKYQSARP